MTSVFSKLFGSPQEAPAVKRSSKPLTDWADLSNEIEGELRWDDITRALYASSASILEVWPDAVLTPRNDQDVIRALRFCARYRVPVTCRGAGSGVVGQSLGEGLIIDFSVHMNRILEVDPQAGFVRFQPGVVKDDLDAELATFGCFWPPDPSSSPWCTAGAMIANNSGGAKSVLYGTARDYLLELQLATIQGERFTLRPLEIGSDGYLRIPYDAQPAERQFAEHAWRILRDPDKRAQLRANRPESTRCSSGLNLFQVASLDTPLPGDRDFKPEAHPKPANLPWPDKDAVGANATGSPWILDMPRLFCGSEGSLAVLLEAKVRIVPRPRSVAGCALAFTSDQQMAEGVVKLLAKSRPAKLELLERSFIDVAAKAEPALAKDIPPGVKTLLIAEYFGVDAPECREQVDEAIRLVTSAEDGEAPLCFHARAAYDPSQLDDVWKIRKVASPILSRVKGDTRPTRWIEDLAVPPWKLPEFIAGLHALLAEEGFSGALFGHAGEGNLHLNPMANVKDPDERERMKRCASKVHDLARSLKGVISGEHGDGAMRAPYLRQMFGDAYDLMVQVKREWDPDWLLNPLTKILKPGLEATHHVLTNARYGEGYERHMTGTGLDAPAVLDEIEKCHGCGKCRTYCPLMRVGKEEKYSARAKANLLRAVVSGKLDPEFLVDPEFKANIDLCINCSQCLVECPTQVDIPGMAIAFREQYLSRTGSNVLGDMLGQPDRLGRVASSVRALTNNVLKNRFLRGLAEKAIDLDERRSLPEYKRELGLPAKRRLEIPVELRERLDLPDEMVVFPGCWANYNDPDGEKNALIRILEALGINAQLPTLRCCGISKITQGDRDNAAKDGRDNVASLMPFVKRGARVMFSAPSCLLATQHDLPRLVRTEFAQQVADASVDAHAFLHRVFSAPELRAQLLPLPADQRKLAYHMPCHSKVSGVGMDPMKLVGLIPEARVDNLDAGCCGLSGTFGMKTDNFDASMKIGLKLFNRVNTVDPDTVFTPCGICQTQIMQGNPGRKVLHPLRLLYDALPG